jgi:hypothetical protein
VKTAAELEKTAIGFIVLTTKTLNNAITPD